MKNRYKLIISTQYFLYFGVFGIFLPYFNLYCYHIGFSGFQIGALSALRSVTLVLFSMILGGLADHFHIRKPIYIFCNFMSMGIWSLYLLTTDFYSMLLITFFYGIFYSPIISFLEAFTMDVLGNEKKRYGKVRVWGSLSFITTVILLGRIIDLYSIDIIIVMILAGSFIQACFAIGVPEIKINKKVSFLSGAKSFLNKKVILFLTSAFLMLVSHGTYYGFFSIHLEQQLGLGKTFIGIAWALASVSEILVMINSEKIFKRFSIDNILFFSFMVAALRWLILFFAHSPVIIIISQLLHAITYGTFHISSILYMDMLSPDESKTLGQAINNAVTYGFGMMVGFFVSGYLYESMGSFSLFMISSIVALAGGILLKAMK